MTALFAIPLLLGVIGLVSWIVVVAYRGTTDGTPGDVATSTLRGHTVLIVAASIGFGMAGLSTLYGGWPTWSTPIAAVVGAVGLVAVTWWLGRHRGS